jgi:hypothetical protein
MASCRSIEIQWGWKVESKYVNNWRKSKSWLKKEYLNFKCKHKKTKNLWKIATLNLIIIQIKIKSTLNTKSIITN